ncbi:hypothetical protein [Salinigranum rubrum]|uniref:hypothetical protein n=1 Tax=Salinigranum rubrum TaxID=755307 RepID=UPI0013A535FB|nr:hypothetical protein [Salinigranum rubrum]
MTEDSSPFGITITPENPSLPVEKITLSARNNTREVWEGNVRAAIVFKNLGKDLYPFYPQSGPASPDIQTLDPGDSFELVLHVDNTGLEEPFLPEDGTRVIRRAGPGRYLFQFQSFRREFSISGDPLELVATDQATVTSRENETINISSSQPWFSANDDVRRATLIVERGDFGIETVDCQNRLLIEDLYNRYTRYTIPLRNCLALMNDSDSRAMITTDVQSVPAFRISSRMKISVNGQPYVLSADDPNSPDSSS